MHETTSHEWLAGYKTGWVHSDGTVCDVHLAPPASTPPTGYWCTVHQMYVRHPETATRTCKCGVTITPAAEGTDWQATDGERPGDFWCADGNLHRPVCPPSAEHDTITTWTNGDGTLNVHPADMIVWVSDFRFVEAIEPHPDGTGVMVQLNDSPWPTYCRGDGLVAVRRYDTDEG